VKGSLLVLLALLLVACVPVPRLGEREVLPTAQVGVVASGGEILTPVSRRAKGGGTPGAVPTPAPWATPLPPTPRPAPLQVEHSVDGGMADCLSCHRGGPSGMPADHDKRTNETCLGCHSSGT
jgi:predicted CXXCH cytochrome family protein